MRYNDMVEGRLDGFPFWLQTSSSDTTICNAPIYWAWSIRNPRFWALSIIPVYSFRKKRELKMASVLTRLLCSLGPWHSQAWLNDWGREILLM